jgi:GNAT superfamily N-acetyltransferase
MTHIKRTTSEDQDFLILVKELDAELAVRDGDDHAFYSQFNKIDKIKHCVVLYENNLPVGCGAIRSFDNISIEIKRMYIHPLARNKGLATMILRELETWSSILGYKNCILETGINQPEAIALYEKNGYHRIPNYGPYIGVDKSYCFGKEV